MKERRSSGMFFAIAVTSAVFFVTGALATPPESPATGKTATVETKQAPCGQVNSPVTKSDAVMNEGCQKKCSMIPDSCKKKCPMMHDSCKKKCAMMNDSCRKKCAMVNDSSKVIGCYTCPMHADVMQKEAGKCPKCKMDLVFQTCKMDAKGKGGCCKMKQQK